MPNTKARTLPASAAIYCRISHDGEGAGLGVKRQEEDCRELAERRGWPVAAVYVDNDVSAWSGKVRPQYAQMLEAVRSGAVDGIVTWHLDRLHRRPAELEAFFDVCDQAGVKHMASVSGDIDLSTDDGRFHARIIGAVARKESDDKSRRIRRKHVELAKAGKAPWGVAVPYGYRYDGDRETFKIVASEAKAVRRVFQQFADGWGLREIARDLEERGVVGGRGRTHWTNTAVARLLDQPMYAGLRRFDGDTVEGNWKPIIDRSLFEKVRTMRETSKAQAPAQNRQGKGERLLSNLATCPCGSIMYRDTYTSRDERSYYVCSNSKRKRWGDCTHGGVSAIRAERYVTEAFLDYLEKPLAKAAKKTPRPKVDRKDDNVEQQLTRLEQRIDRLLDELSEVPPSLAPAVRRKLEALETERETIRRRSLRDASTVMEQRQKDDQLQALRAKRSDIRAVWELATTPERNAMLRAAIEEVKVSGTGRPKKIEIVWRAA